MATPEPAHKPFAPLLMRVSLATLAVLLILLLGGGWWSYQRHVEEARNGTDSIARLLANQTARTFDATNLALVRLAEIAAKTDWSDANDAAAAEAEFVALRFRLPFVSRAFIIGPDGLVRVSTLGEAARSIDASGRDYFRSMREGNLEFYVSPAIPALVDGVPVVILARRVEARDGTFAGAATISFPTDELRTFFDGLSARYASVMLMLGPDGKIITVEPPNDIDLDGKLHDARALSHAEGIGVGSVATGTRYWSFRRAGSFPIDIAVGTSVQAIRSAWLSSATPYVAFMLSVMAALGTLMMIAYRHAGTEDAYRGRLAETNADLERRVATRTADLEAANGRLRGALEERDVLLREIHHRVKNNMQVIASLLSIQSNSVNPQLRPYFQDNMQRIRAMARIHESLYASDNLSQVDFAAYLGSLCDDLKRSYGATDRIDCGISGPSLSFPIDIATPLGLLLSEVISNCLKHGYPTEAGGKIQIAIERDGEDFAFVVQDDGAGLPPDIDLTTERSMGLRLIRILSQQLGATYAFERPPSGGTVFRLLLHRPAGTEVA
ncbi:MAG: sensor histidine kinase [Alphaproteobacteria bacterium]